MSDNKMISIASMDKIVNDVEESVTINFHGEELVVKKFLPFVDMIKFVNEVVEGCFDDDNGAYLPEAKTFLAQINTVSYYSNVRLPDDPKHKYDILNKTDLVEVIANAVDRTQYQAIIRSIEEKINYRVAMNEQAFNSRMNATITTIEALVDSIKDSFDGVTPDDVRKLISAINNNSIDEGKLVEAFANIKEDASNEEATENGETDVV